MVFGTGSPDAALVFVGEAPGKQEDLSGEPFVGASGKLLNEMLASIGLERSDIYITNIVKYRPPANRDPSKAEIAAMEESLSGADRRARNAEARVIEAKKILSQVEDSIRNKLLSKGHPSMNRLVAAA